MSLTYPLWVAGEARQPNADLAVFNKYSRDVYARVALADAATVDAAIAAAVDAAPTFARTPAWQRRDALNRLANTLEARTEDFARALCAEVGKPLKDARGEVGRAVDTFRIAAEECSRIGGEIMDLEISPRSQGYRGMFKRVPVGPVALIAPFNFPLNLVAHKVAPAIATGCPFVLKPASRTPVVSLLLAEILAECGLPAGSWSVLATGRREADLLVTDDRLKLLSFTGSAAVGWDMKARAGRKKVLLELGGNAACIVDADADVDDAVRRLIIGAFYQSGQSCISVQRILVHASLIDALRDKLVAAARALPAGDPADPNTFLGPMIDEAEAVRLDGWIREAVDAGGRLLCGGHRDAATLDATLVEDVPHGCALWAQEAFGPAACLEAFTDFNAALNTVNDSRYGLQAGVFTRDIHKAMRAWDLLEVGGVVINDVPSFRVDSMPYGGVKDSGLGREGVRTAIEEMTELRMFVLRDAT